MKTHWDNKEDKLVKIKRFIGGILESNGYVLYQQEGGACYVVDPGYSSKTLNI